MTTYAVEFSKTAQKELAKLSPQTALRILRAIHKLAKNPRSDNVRPMVGSKAWRLRVGDYRVIYDIHNKKLVVLIIKVDHRRDIYKN